MILGVEKALVERERNMRDRAERVGKLIEREISLILQTEIDDPRMQGIAITKVEMTKDIKFARVFYVFYGDKNREEEAENALMSHVKHVRKVVGERVSLRFVPELSFRKDKSEEYRETVDEIFKKLALEKQEKGPQNSGREGETNEL